MNWRACPWIVPVLASTLVACGELNVSAVDVAEVEVVPDTTSIPVGTSRQLEVRVRDAAGNLLSGRAVSWSSSDPGLARADDDGRVTGVAPGTAMISARTGGVSGTARVDVLPAGVIRTEPEQLSISLVGGATATETIAITNAGAGQLTGLSATVAFTSQPGDWLTAALQGTTAPTSLTLSAAAGSLPVGVYQATVTIATTSPGVASRTLPVELRVTAASPSIGLASSSVSFTVATGAPDPDARTVAVTNAGGGSLTGLGASVTYGAGQPADWLVASLSPSTAPSTLTLAVRAAGLAPGTYEAAVQVISPGADNSPASVEVTLNVTEPGPAIGLSETSRLFTAVAGGPNPGQHAITVTNEGGGALTGLTATVTFSAGQPENWLTATLSGPAAPATLMLQTAIGGLAAGTYTATVEVSSPDAVNSPRTVNVSLQITAPAAAPAIGLSADTATFTATAGAANPQSRTIDVVNAGTGSLSNLTATVNYAAGEPTGWLAATLGATTAPTTLTLQATTGALAPGSYNASVVVASTVASNSPRTVAVTFVVSAAPVPPAIALSASTAAFTATAGGTSPAAQPIAVTNSGGGTLTGLGAAIQYGTGQATGWLSATLSSTSAPSTLTLQATTGSLAAGTYTATVQVTAAGASNSPQTVAIEFRVDAAPVPPAIGLNPGSVAFSATALGGNPQPQTVAVTNTGGGTLGDLTTQIDYSSGSGWLAATLSSTTAPATITLQATTGLRLPGTYTATVRVLSPGASNSPQSIAVTFQITAPILPPAIGVNPTSLTFNAVAGAANPGTQQVQVTNTGGSLLDDLTTSIAYTTGQPTGWLAATLGSAVAPTTLSVQAATGSLTVGTYTATIEVRSAKANNSPRTVAVTFQIAAPPPPPAAPNMLRANENGQTRIDLDWRDNSGNEENFVLQRSVDGGGTWATISTLPANTKQHSDTGLQRNTRYWYRVQACNAGGCSAYSNTANARTRN